MAGGAGDNLVDLRLDFELGDEVMLSVGGVWNRRLEDFDTDPDTGEARQAETGVVVRMHPGQAQSVAWFAGWLDEHQERRLNPPPFDPYDPEAAELDNDPSHAYAALFAGGRRGGKSWIAVALAAAYAVMFPGSIVWIVSPSDRKHDEVRRYMSALLAEAWVDRETHEDGWELINGSVVFLKSGWTPEGLKEGEVDFCVLNEGQRMKHRAYVLARGAVNDRSGCVLVCANPPCEEGDEQWVSDFAAEAKAGTRAAVYIEFDPLQNPHIDRRGLLAMRFELDRRTYEIEVLGKFLGPKDAVAYNWDRLVNEQSAPDEYSSLVDVTEEFLYLIGEGEGIRSVIGIDFQRYPHIGGPVYQFYADPAVTPTRDNVIAWIVDEIVLDGGDEIDWCHALADRRIGGKPDGELLYPPDTTLIIGDASGQYQHTRRRAADSPPPEWKGKGSFHLIMGEGWRKIRPPSRLHPGKNPEIVDRVRSFTSMICSYANVRRLYADPKRAPRTCKAIREWRTVHGKPARTHEQAHLGDAASYPMIRIFPRILRSGNTPGGDTVIATVDRPQTYPSDLVARPRGGRRPNRTRGM